jgi:hypothetical protein
MVVSAGFTGTITMGKSSADAYPALPPSSTAIQAQTSKRETLRQKGEAWGISRKRPGKGAIAQAESTPPSATPSFYLILANVKMQQLGKTSCGRGPQSPRIAPLFRREREGVRILSWATETAGSSAIDKMMDEARLFPWRRCAFVQDSLLWPLLRALPEMSPLSQREMGPICRHALREAADLG